MNWALIGIVILGFPFVAHGHVVGDSAWCIGYNDFHFECHFAAQAACEQSLTKAAPITFQDELTGGSPTSKSDFKKVTRYCTQNPRKSFESSPKGSGFNGL